MIDAVSRVSFRGDNADLINAPGKFSASVPDMPADSFEKTGEKKSNKGVKIAIATAIAALVALAGLGYAARTGKLAKVEIKDDAGFFGKALAKIKNAAAQVGEFVNNKCYNKIFSEKVAEVVEGAEGAV